jgi:hypothetical protein
MLDVDPSSAQLWKVFLPICQLFLCKNDFATALAGSCRSSAVARFMQYEDCIGALFPREERTPTLAIRQ